MTQTETNKLPWKKRLCYWFAAVFIVFLSFSVVELSLRIFISPPVKGYADPYVSFKQTMPLFILDSERGEYTTDENRLIFFRSQSFKAQKPGNEFRIFCLGGSTVQGRPYSVETSFTSWLEINLKAADPQRHWKVINCGGISYASYRLVPIMKELLEYEPDMFIIYTGHNEFLEDRTYGKIKQAPAVIVKLNRSLLNLRTYQLVHNYVWSKSPEAAVLPGEVQAVLDFEKGLESYTRDDQWAQGVITHFAHNLEVMVNIAQDAGLPVILMNPAYNLKDSPPFKSQFSITDPEDKQEVLRLWAQSQQVGWDDIYGKIRLLEKAAEIEPGHAGLLYLLGTCYHRLGRYDDAKQWYLKAKEQDVCPLRILESMRDEIAETASGYSVPCIDVQSAFERISEGGITGNLQLLDHVHPTIKSHQLIADMLILEIQKMDLLNLSGGWIAGRDKLIKEHLSGLNDAYYEQGNARLKRLNEWSRGRIPQLPVLSEDQ